MPSIPGEESTMRPHPILFLATLALACATPAPASAGAGAPPALAAKDCTRDTSGLIPLNDLGVGSYLGEVGGLYGGGSNLPPFQHAHDGLRVARAVVSLDTLGAADPAGGRTVLLSLGGNSAMLQFAVFIDRVAADPSVHPQLRVVNGAADGFDLVAAADPQSAYWDTVATRLRGLGSSPAQVQVVWMKFYIDSTVGDFAATTDSSARLLTRAIRNATMRLPNLRLLYLTPDIYTGYDNSAALTEPHGYWTGFAVRRVILSQVAGDSLNFDPARGPVEAPWIDWGPYLWADGTVARSDGLTWLCSDYVGNGVVPSQAGRGKFADSLLAFVQDAATTAPWYLALPTLDAPATPDLAPRLSFALAPNPASSAVRFRVAVGEGAWTLQVLDLQSRVRREFAGAGAGEVTWDLRDRDGAALGTGVYWASLRHAGGRLTRTLVVR
jgi:hypothetical protein